MMYTQQILTKIRDRMPLIVLSTQDLMEVSHFSPLSFKINLSLNYKQISNFAKLNVLLNNGEEAK